jgi:elongation factor Tu
MPERRIQVAVIGHMDHGATTLTAAIVARQAYKKHIDRFPRYGDLTRRGVVRDRLKTVSVDLVYVEYETPARGYHHTDCPAWPRGMVEITSTLAKVDGVILVVAADQGPMPRTREYVALARQYEVPSIVAFLTRVDRVDAPDLLGSPNSRCASC